MHLLSVNCQLFTVNLLLFQLHSARQRRIMMMWVCLVPEYYGAYIGSLYEVFSIVFPTEILYRDLQTFFETDGIHDMPPVEAKSFLGII